MSFRFCWVNCGSCDEALAIGRRVVEERLAASANVLDSMTSIYHWQGRIEQASEAVLILKTQDTLVEPLTRRIVELHSYEVPCVIALAIDQGNPGYLGWIAAETMAPAHADEVE